MPAMSGDGRIDIAERLQSIVDLLLIRERHKQFEAGNLEMLARTIDEGRDEICRLRAAHAALLTERDALAERLRELERGDDEEIEMPRPVAGRSFPVTMGKTVIRDTLDLDPEEPDA
jgi:predicted metal-dependent hydrolase